MIISVFVCLYFGIEFHIVSIRPLQPLICCPLHLALAVSFPIIFLSPIFDTLKAGHFVFLLNISYIYHISACVAPTSIKFKNILEIFILYF